MQSFAIFFLFLLGAIFGSFASVVIYRIKSGKAGIMTGRSECPYCGKTLGALELIPILSYAFQKGKCAGCGKDIPFTYPALETVMGVAFVVSGVFLCDLSAILAGNTAEIGRLAFFLSVSFVSVVTAFYDILFMEIPDELLVPATAIIGILLWQLPENTALFRHFVPITDDSFVTEWSNGRNALLGAAGAYTFFYLQFLLPAGFHCLKNRRYRDALSVAAHYVLLPFAVVRELFRKKHAPHSPEEELPTWIGLGDLRIAIFMGFVAGAKIAGLGVFLAYLIGSVFGIYVLAIRRERNVAVPFGPFLIAGLFASLLWYDPAIRLVFPTAF
jgi:prepilin signal peptidase PulO-like enzyme (type II secretory pathway)